MGTCDLYDRRLWNQYSGFFSQSRSIGLMLNIDLFQSFDHTTKCWPRKERFKKENIILVGVLQAIEHEPCHVNSFLNPLVQEMKCLYNGETFFTAESPRYRLTFHALLLCAACDVLAVWKLCGLKGHAANLGCSRCLKVFPGEIGNKL